LKKDFESTKISTNDPRYK
jgi:predicted  nucleic acid-binding Zn-ribbon protein